MRRFRFRLGRVLRVRRLQEEVARAAFLEARAEADRARAALERARERLAAGRAELAELQARPRLEPAEVIRQQETLLALQRALGPLRSRAERREEAAAERQAAWSEARAAVRGLERLEARRRGAHRAELERLETREQDERALARGAASPRAGTAAIAPAAAVPAGSSQGPAAADEASWTAPGPRPDAPTGPA